MGGKKPKVDKASKARKATKGTPTSNPESRAPSDDEQEAPPRVDESEPADGQSSEEEEDADDDGDASAPSAGTHAPRCKHALKSIKAIQGKLKALPSMLAHALLAHEKAHAGAPPAAAAKKRSTAAPTGDAACCWVCLACGDSDTKASPSHFTKKHEVGLDLVSHRWRCFACQLDLTETTTKPAAMAKLRLLSGLVEKTLGSSAKKGAATAAASARDRARHEADDERATSARMEAAPSSAMAVALSSGVPSAKGLRNLGNTCFMNSVLQCLAATAPLYGALLYPSSALYSDNSINMAHPLQTALFNFLQQMAKAGSVTAPPAPPVDHGKKSKHRHSAAASDEAKVLSPSSLLSAVQTLNPFFRGNRQHDAHELLRTILNGVCLEFEEAQRKKRQAIAWQVVRGWSAERVLQWVDTWPLSSKDAVQTVATNLLTDEKHVWDGPFVLFLIEHWQDTKKTKAARIQLHLQVQTKEDQRVIARMLQRIKDGVLPEFSATNEQAMAGEDQADGSGSSDSALAPPLHPFDSLLQSTFVHRVFGGVSRNTVECLACHTVSVTHELFFDLSLAIEAPKVVAPKSAAPAAPASTVATSSSSSASTPTKSASKSSARGKHLSKQARKAQKRQGRSGGTTKNDGERFPPPDEEDEGEGDEEGDHPEKEADTTTPPTVQPAAIDSTFRSVDAHLPPTFDWIRTLPKVEMHAHLSGSVREETVLQLLAEEAALIGGSASSVDGSPPSAASSSEIRTFKFGDRTLSECFDVFKILHRLLRDVGAVARITREVIQDFTREETIYLELRTTPRPMNIGTERATTARQYVESVVQTIRECEETVRTPSGERICVRLLLSIDRSQSLDAAEHTVDLAIEFARHRDPIVVGLDFSGNPTVGSFRRFLPCFLRARSEGGLKASIHVGEKADDGDDLDAALFEFKPERLGHVVCLDQRHIDHLLDQPIPIEICPTSNLKTQIVKEWRDHPFGVWREERKKRWENGRTPGDKEANKQEEEAVDSTTNGGPSEKAATAIEETAAVASGSPACAAGDGHGAHYPMVVCTDDSGVFNITLTSELHQLSQTFSLSRDELFHMEQRAVQYGFVDDGRKAELTKIFERFHEREAKAAGTQPKQTTGETQGQEEMTPVATTVTTDSSNADSATPSADAVATAAADSVAALLAKLHLESPATAATADCLPVVGAPSASSSVSAPLGASPSPAAAAASDFQAYARAHHLGFGRLQSSQRCSIRDSLRAFTDPDLLQGNNKYGCKECSRRAQDQALFGVGVGVDGAATRKALEATGPSNDGAADAIQPMSSPSPPADKREAESQTPDESAATVTSEAVESPSDESASQLDGSIVPSDGHPEREVAKADPPPPDHSMPVEPEPSPPPPPIWIKQEAIKRCQVLVAPQVLTLHLKRFHFTSRSLEKSSKGVDFPLCFNLREMMAPAIPPDEVQPFEPHQHASGGGGDSVPDVWYHLYGIVVHGGGMSGGHYVALMRKRDLSAACSSDTAAHSSAECPMDAQELTRGWFYASDSEVHPVSVTEALKAQAYILMYERV